MYATNPHETAHLPDPAPLDITFADLDLKLKTEQVFKEEMLTERAKELIGKRVRIEGVMYPPLRSHDLSEFVLMKFIPQSFGPGQPADTLIVVKLREGISAEYPGDERLTVEGVLRLDPFPGLDGDTWSIYGLEDASNAAIVKPFRRTSK